MNTTLSRIWDEMYSMSGDSVTYILQTYKIVQA